ncbi:TIGR03545 family protein [Paraglaciecola aestuariivivens]
MRSLIRLPGVLAFIGIVALIAAVTLLFLDFWIKIIAEKSLGQAHGAEVNIARVEHSFSPFGVELFDLQLTDPSQPTHNKVAAQSVSANIQLAPLLLRKVIIDELKIQGLAFATLRESEGEVYQPIELSKSLSAPFLGEDAKIPSVDEILANSPLKTTKAVQDTQAVYEKHSEILKKQYADLPSKEQLAAFQARFKALTETDYQDPAKLLAAKQEFEKLKQEVQEQQQKLKAFQQAVKQAKAELGPQIAQLKAAPKQDYQNLQALIAGDAQAIENVTKLVFGEQIAQWSQYALAAFDIVGPMLKKQQQDEQSQNAEQGQWIAFDDSSKLPDLWIKQAQLSINWQQEQVVSHWQNITHQHDKIGQATTFTLQSQQSALWQSLQLAGDFWLGEAGIQAQQDWQLLGLRLAELPLIKQDKLASVLHQGQLSSRGQLGIQKAQLQGSSSIDLSQLSISAEGKNNLTKLIAQSLNNLKQLTINTDIGGTLGAIDLSLSSDLNKQLGQALLNNLSPEQQSKLTELQQKLAAKSQGLLGEQQANLTQWNNWQELAEGDLSQVNKLIEAKFTSLVDKQKDKLKDKLLNNLFN